MKVGSITMQSGENTEKNIWRTVKKDMEVKKKMALGLPGVNNPCVKGGSTGTEHTHR